MNRENSKSAFLICPVRGVTLSETKYIEKYISKLEKKGYKVHYPPRDTNQIDSIGLRICSDNCEAIRKSDEIHIYWNEKSTGSLFDFGMAFMLKKPILLANRKDVKPTPHKSFENILLELDKKYN